MIPREEKIKLNKNENSIGHPPVGCLIIITITIIFMRTSAKPVGGNIEVSNVIWLQRRLIQ